MTLQTPSSNPSSNLAPKVISPYQSVRFKSGASSVTLQKKGHRLRSFCLWAFGVVMPLIILAVELATGMCGATFFDPIGTWLHVLLVLFVPVTSAWLIFKKNQLLETKKVTQVPLMATLSGASIVIGTAYGLLYLFLIPLSLIALLFFGLGLLSLTPVLSAITTWRIRALLKKLSGSPRDWNPWFYGGVSIALSVLCFLEAGPIWTRAGLIQATSADQEQVEKGLARLRWKASERTLAMFVVESENFGAPADISGWIFKGWSFLSFTDAFRWVDTNSNDSENAHKVYYQVTGKAANSYERSWLDAGPIRPLEALNGGGRRTYSDDVTFDNHLGSEEVASKVSGLTMEKSEIEGHLEPISGLGYQEWTVVFQNKSSRDREARMQVQLPPNGHVSRATLWINGEPCEAAFAGKDTVRKAYQEIAVVQRRDPLLVTASGPNRVLVQCFPILAQGEMKIRLGITAPLLGGEMLTPTVLEQNFRSGKSLRHQVSYQSSVGFLLGAQGSHVVEDYHRARWSGADLSKARASLREDAMGEGPVWCRDPFAQVGEEILRRELIEKNDPPLARCGIVIDGSAELARYRNRLAHVLSKKLAIEVRIFVANDGVEVIDHPSDLQGWNFTGGRDNTPALLSALRWAQSEDMSSSSAVVWISGAQPVDFGKQEALVDFFEQGKPEVAIHAISLGKGRNVLLEVLAQYHFLKMAPPMENFENDLARFLQKLENLENTEPQKIAQWTRHPLSETEALSETEISTELGREVWDQLARHWAGQKVNSLTRAEKTDAANIAFAASYQLVTSVSGAVVLENAEQYKRHGLHPVSATNTASVPNVPEPSVTLSLLLAGLLALSKRQRITPAR